MIPFLQLTPGEDAAAVRAAIDARRRRAAGSCSGPSSRPSSSEFAAACGAPHAVGVGTGTDALAIALRALGIGPGDEVITSPLSAAYSALAIMMAGARPVFADIDPDRLTLDPRAAAAAVTPRTAAIMPVHLYGQPADMPAIAAVARAPQPRDRRGLLPGAPGDVRRPAGRQLRRRGGLQLLSDQEPRRARRRRRADDQRRRRSRRGRKRLRNGGQTDRYHHDEFGVNSRLDEMQAAILRARLPLLPGWTARRRALAGRVPRGARAASTTIAVPPELDPGHVYHLFPVRSAARDAMQAHLRAAGVETLIHYPMPIPRQPALAAEQPAECPIADRVCARGLLAAALPVARPRARSRRSPTALAGGPAPCSRERGRAALSRRGADAPPRARCFVANRGGAVRLFEAALRTWGSSEAAPAFQGLFEHDPAIGYRLKPHARTRFTTARVRHRDRASTAAGVRDDEEIGPKAPDERRIVLLGDSLVLSVQVPFQQTFGELLEQRLNARSSPYPLPRDQRRRAGLRTGRGAAVLPVDRARRCSPTW